MANIKNIGHSINAKLKNLAAETNVAFDYILLRYALERFLYRLGCSSFSKYFVLKGASVFSIWFDPIFRVTRDADLYCAKNFDAEHLKACFVAICQQPVEADGVDFDLASMQTNEIKQEQPYQGIRITFTATIAQARVNLQFDIGFGDVVFPAAKFSEYPVLLNGAKPKIKIYPRYAVIAEKFEAMVTLGMKNSRLKDFFDIWQLAEQFEFDFSILQKSIMRTFKRRKTKMPATMPIALTNEFALDKIKISQWNAFLRKMDFKRLESLIAIVERINEFLHPIIYPPISLPEKWQGGVGWE